ncbi:hypothetical protein MPLSOD_260055 [Mesorhizobium sp. SOD10]|nr:hypothetical protein MPLSOD_260055 [Mesorhizobium sp. SOD10]
MAFRGRLDLKAKREGSREPSSAGKLECQLAAASPDGTSLANATLEAVVRVSSQLAEMTMAIGSQCCMAAVNRSIDATLFNDMIQLLRLCS